MKTSELIGPALDWAVAKCEFPDPDYCDEDRLVYVTCELDHGMGTFTPSTKWSQGGPIIEREKIVVAPYNNQNWHAWPFSNFDSDSITGTTPLIAAMRCYVASKLGDEVDIPNELKG